MQFLKDEELTERERVMLAQDDGLYSLPVRTPEGGLSCVAKFLFTHAIIHELGNSGYEDRWCYHTELDAARALLAWSGEDGTEPDGWHRHPDTDRRR